MEPAPTKAKDGRVFPACGQPQPIDSQRRFVDFFERTLQTLRIVFHRDRGDTHPPPIPSTPTDPSSEIVCHHSCRLNEEELPGFSVNPIGDHPVALGGYSDVWKGTLKRDEGPTDLLVAIKVLRNLGHNSKSHGLRKQLQREVRIWKPLNHESIVELCGVTYTTDGAPAMISPWYANGSADVYLQNHLNVNPMKTICEIALGVEYLHENGVVHGDLKGANVMIDDTGHAKLIDFGLSRLVDTVVVPTGFTMSTLSFSIRWCAPELLLCDNAKATKATDVYACASTALELLTGDVPYSSQRDVIVLRAIMNKVPPQRPLSPLRYSVRNVDSLWELLGGCWSEVSERPSASGFQERLRTFYP